MFMSQVIDNFAADCRAHLKDGPSDAALDKVVEGLKKVLVSKEVIDTYFPPENTTERKVIYEDSEMGFCILAHVNTGAKSSPPHDHGPAWAIYGQVEGETEMTEYARAEEPKDGLPGKAKPVKTYMMTPGAAVHYNVGKLHAPERAAATRLIRMEGQNMDKVTRDAFVKVLD
jgi:predicted metal-dependent enzyme (double-stranded beta helix superfamily)